MQEYVPVFAPGLFEPLLLRKRSQMERLKEFEEYVRLRCEKASYKGLHIFQSINERGSFSVQFFDVPYIISP